MGYSKFFNFSTNCKGTSLRLETKVVDISEKPFNRQNKIKWKRLYVQLCKPQEPGDKKLKMVCKYFLDALF